MWKSKQKKGLSEIEKIKNEFNNEFEKADDEAKSMKTESMLVIQKLILYKTEESHYEYLRSLVKLYTGSLYPVIGSCLSSNNFRPFSTYFTQMIYQFG